MKTKNMSANASLTVAFALLLAFSLSARAITLPPIFDGVTITEDAVKLIPSKDGGAAFIAIRIISQDSNVYRFFDEAVWKANVNTALFMNASTTDARQQFVSVFCAMNTDACTQTETGDIAVSNAVPWRIPVATALTSQVQSVVNSIITPTPPVLEKDTTQKERVVNQNGMTIRQVPLKTPTVKEEQVAQKEPSPTPHPTPQRVAPNQHKVIWSEPPAEILRGFVWDDEPHPAENQRQTIIWDD